MSRMRHLSGLTVEATFDGAAPDVSHVPGVTVLETHDHLVRCQVSGPVDPLLKLLAASGVHRLLSREQSLEELFLAHYGHTSVKPREAVDVH